MRFRNIPYEKLKSELEGKTVVQFGASSAWGYFEKVFTDIDKTLVDCTEYVVDNNRDKQGCDFSILGKRFSISTPDILRNLDNLIIVITVSLAYQKNICEQLIKMNLPEDTICVSLPLMTYADRIIDNSCVDEYFEGKTEIKIPAVIHSFWFSKEEKPDLYKKCLDSWYRFCPNFKIIEWNADTYDVNKNRYMAEAFEMKKWAFVSDYARLDILYEQGGIYMDMDVELISSPDELLKASSFFLRQEDGMLELGSGFGVQKNDEFIGQLLKAYEGRRLIGNDGQIDKTPQPTFLAGLFEKNGIYKCHDSEVIDDRLILSNDYITCTNGNNPLETARLGVHWHNGGWLDNKERELIHSSLEARKMLITDYFGDRI